MESNKYYNPELDEFHIGFEYQCLDELVKDWDREFAGKKDFLGHIIPEDINKYKKINFGWKDKIFNLSDYIIHNEVQWKQIENILEPTLPHFRVKYLDQEDIKSLGWKLKHPGVIIDDVPRFVQYTKQGHESICLLEVFISNPPMIRIDEILNYSYTKFAGIIKNKSELKKLMKQLNIE